MVTFRALFLSTVAAAAAALANARPPPRFLSQQERHYSHSNHAVSNDALHSPVTTPHRHLQAQTSESDDKLRSDLLANYDRGSFPFQAIWNTTTNNGTRTGLPIEVGINFHRVFAVDIINSVAELTVWFRQQWVDPRLAWNPDDYNGTTTVWFYISDGVGSAEASEIWTPDIELWNMAYSIKDTLTDTYASVSSDGRVFWSRPGRLKPACKFQGLDSFPFDMLSCTMEFGSWSYSGLYIRPVKFDGIGYSIGGSETAGESFSEYQLAPEDAVTCREQIYPPFAGAPEEDWPVLLFDVKFHRSWEPYARGYIVMQIILNFAGFSAFWLPVQCGERMGLTITSLLAAVASELVVSSNLPSASEMTWFQSFSLFSLAFGAITIFESAVVIYFFYYTGSDLKPRWWKWIEGRASPIVDSYKQRRATRRNKDSTEDMPSVNDDCIPENGGDLSSVHDFMPAENDIAVGVAADSAVAVESPQHDHVGFRNGKTAPYASSTEEVAPASSIRRRKERRNSMARDADDFLDNLEAENNKRWKKVACNIDEVFRVVIPTAYVIALSIYLQAVDKN